MKQSVDLVSLYFLNLRFVLMFLLLFDRSKMKKDGSTP